MKSKKTLLCVPLYAWAVLFVGLPLMYIVAVSFFTRGASWGMTDELTLDNYKRLFDPIYVKAFGQSILTAGLTSILTVLIGYPFAYAMAKAAPKRRMLLMILVVVPFWTSSLIRTYGWIILMRANGPINSLLQALGIIDRPLKLLYSEGAVLLGLVYSLLPLMILPCYTKIDQIDWHAMEAARDLGASPLQATVTVLLPLTYTGIIAGLTLTFVPCMGLFFISDLLGGNKVVLLGNLIQDQLLRARNTPFGAAIAVVMLIMAALVLWAQRKLGGETTLM